MSSLIKPTTSASKNLINTAAIEHQLYKRQLIADDLKVSTFHPFIIYYGVMILLLFLES